MDFLRGTTVLLKSGQGELDFSIRYNRQRYTYQGMFNSKEIFNTTVRRLELALGYRHGFANRLETWFRVPYVYSHAEYVSGNDFVKNEDRAKMGDVQFGFQYLALPQQRGYPSITLSLRASAPTGERSYYEPPEDWFNLLSNGSGHWMVSPSLDFTKNVDPVILFGGVSYEYTFANRIDGHEYEPGQGVGLYSGFGFAVNSRFSLSSRLYWSYYDNMKLDGVKMQGSSSEPINIGFSGSYRVWDTVVATPTVQFGLNDDAGSAPTLALTFSKKL